MNYRITLIIIISQLFIGCSELRIGEEALKKQYLLEIPIGTSYNKVNTKLLSYNLPKDLVYHDKGGCSKNGNRTKGRIIRAYMGWYLDFVLPNKTFTMWCFNETETLIDLKVIQQIDSL
jgi:hypothetical protein